MSVFGRSNVMSKALSKPARASVTAREQKLERLSKRQKVLRNMKRYWFLYLLFLPTLIFLCVFNYWPIFLQFILSFKEYTFLGGIWGSEWVGLENFIEIFSTPEISRVILNTIRISLINIVISFVPPIILSILLFDLRSNLLRKVTQNLLYIPYFFSWIIIYAVFYAIFANTGALNSLLQQFGLPMQNFMIEKEYFIPMLIVSSLYKNLGWSTIIYMAALTSIDTELFEAAKIDGAGPIARIRYITLPSIKSISIFVLTLSLGNILVVGTEQILLFYTPASYEIGDVIGTWIYRQGLGKMEYSLGAAMSMFQSVIGFILVMCSNVFAKKFAKVGIW